MLIAKTSLSIFFFMLKWSLPSPWPQINCKWIMFLINSISEFLSEFYIHSWAISLFGDLKNFSIWTYPKLNQSLPVSKNFQFYLLYIIFFFLYLYLHCEHPTLIYYYLSSNSIFTVSQNLFWWTSIKVKQFFPKIVILSFIILKPIHQNSVWVFIMSVLKFVIYCIVSRK